MKLSNLYFLRGHLMAMASYNRPMLEEIIIRTLCDTLPHASTNAVFLFGQTEDNQESVFDSALYLLKNGLAKKVMFLETEAMSGYPGFKVWRDKLLTLGLNPEAILPVPVPAGTTQLNTRIEAEAAIHLAKEKGFERLLVTASPFQQPRAFMAAVTAVLEYNADIKVYSYPGKSLAWCQQVKHSQGKVTGTRADLISGEMERIHKYNAKGDLAKVDEVLSYMNRRDVGELS